MLLKNPERFLVADRLSSPREGDLTIDFLRCLSVMVGDSGGGSGEDEAGKLGLPDSATLER